MKKLIVWATMAALLTAGSAFAAGGRNLVAQPDATFAVGNPATTDNDDSCDIGVTPAATLLLPYFEVDVTEPTTTANTTLFTITNVSRLPQIAHVTVWTDWSFPVLDFNIFLTGYDVQSINMYDIIVRGVIAPSAPGALTGGTSIDSDPGSLSADNDDNILFQGNAYTNCVDLPGQIPPVILTDVQSALTTGVHSSCSGSNRVGGNHAATARGYVTIDVSSTCSTSLPTDALYFTTEVLFDNVFIGDYQQVNPDNATGNYAGGNPLVHIRAIPEGGAAGVPVATNLPWTFYSRYQAGGTFDRRQPLPSTFAARFIAGGTGSFNTDYKIWREGTATGATSACTSAYRSNGAIGITEFVRFDERENPTTRAGGIIISPFPTTNITLPEASRVSAVDTIFPPLSTSGDVAGWMYMNLDDPSHSFATDAERANQNWVIVSMSAEGRFAVDFDAAWLGNGCSEVTGVTSELVNPIGPNSNVNP